MSSALIKLTGISRYFRTDEVETAALHDVNLTINEQDFLAIMGPSGCGKSTLMNVLGLLDRVSDGSYELMGKETTSLGEVSLAELRREHIGFVFQNFNLIDDLTIAQNVELSFAYTDGSKRDRRQRAEIAMERVGIGHRSDHYPSQLSGGQQQRAAIARAIAGTPQLILADEPTGNLDSSNSTQVMKILRELNDQGTTVVIVTHSESEALQAKKVLHMLDGQIDESRQRIG